MKSFFFTLCLAGGLLLFSGCAPKVQLVTPEPVKVDVNMKVELTSRQATAQAGPVATSGPSDETRRRHRVSEVNNLLYRGVAGIDHKGMLVQRPLGPSDSDADYISKTISAENDDRLKLISQEVEKSGKSAEQVRNEFTRRIHDGVAPGTWIEVQDDKGNMVWKRK